MQKIRDVGDWLGYSVRGHRGYDIFIRRHVRSSRKHDPKDSFDRDVNIFSAIFCLTTSFVGDPLQYIVGLKGAVDT